MAANKLHIALTTEARAFVKSLPEKARQKIVYNINLVEGGKLDKTLFKKLNDDIWELRTLCAGACYRLLAFWDTEEGALVIATHGFEKKTQKTPRKEIARAEAIMKQYFANKS